MAAYQAVPLQDLNAQAVPLPPGAPVQVMQRPASIPGVPAGLEYLTMIDGLFVKQQVSLTEVITGLDTNNKYVISNQLGQQCYFAAEESSHCARIFCGPRRGFTFRIFDNLQQEVLKVTREFKCCAGCQICAFCCDCAAYEVTIELPDGTPVGYVKQSGSFWRAKFDILDENHQKILKVLGPCCILDGPLCCTDNKFQLLTPDGTEIGSVVKKYSGFVREVGTSADNFGVTFPLDLSVKAKSSLLGALLLIDFMFFEKAQQPGNNRRTAFT